MRFQFPVPTGWAVDNTASQVLIYPKAQDAAMLLTVAPEATPAAAASAFITGTEATVLTSADVKVSGLAARRVVCDVATEQGVMRVLGYFIQKAGVVYSFIGYAGQAQFDGYLGTFEQTMGRFKNLTDLARINVKPERLTIRAVPAVSCAGLRTSASSRIASRSTRSSMGWVSTTPCVQTRC
jgi:predicted Zn-dependent protease